MSLSSPSRLLAPILLFALAGCGDTTQTTDGAPSDLSTVGDIATPAGDIAAAADLSQTGGDAAGDLATDDQMIGDGPIATDDGGMTGDGAMSTDGGSAMDGGGAMDGATMDGAMGDGAGPGCSAQSCPNGCCDGKGACTNPSMGACGTAGMACVACDPLRADGCGAGACTCGNGPACAAGQACAAGNCVCNAQSCPNGCCDGNVCRTSSLSTCGTGGGACIDCGKLGDACTNGVCTCGGNVACDAGQACSLGTCVCNINSCLNGCCNGNVCTNPTVATCGAPGVKCFACDPVAADNCDGGSCACGMGPPCGAGQRCANGACVCDAQSCPMGCCNGNVCTTPSNANCGANGSICTACPQGQQCTNGVCSGCAQNCKGCCNGDTCVDPPTASACGAGNGAACMACDLRLADTCAQGGICQCGANPPCAAGQQCVSGVCKCTPSSCANGCCNGDTCMTASLMSCGTLGGACSTCDMNLADNCNAGTCDCGNGPACTMGQHCMNGQCVCDMTSCANGCCSGNVCNTPSITNCGTSGGACTACSTNTADGCTNGACTCGKNPACGAGLACVNGQCVCNGTSCPTGCCANNVCQPGNTAGACGSGGAACVACAQGTSCAGGVCAGCAQVCQGCCSGNTCNAPSLAACGPAGGACVACNTQLADSCNPAAGGCRCGNGPACVTGQACVNGACVCNAQSCANGCCSSNTCFVGVNCATCKTYHQACAQNTDCCSDNCQGGICGVPLGQCLLANNVCTKNADCCSGHCDVDVDGKLRCTLPNQCKGIGSACTAASDCCTLYCDPATKLCSNAKVCTPAGMGCMSNVECCTNLCQNGSCVNGGACNNLGESCSGNNCCSNSCIGGKCFWDYWCRSMGDLCNANADCCSGVCDTMKHRCDSVSQCVPTNEPCTGLRSCCNTLCVDNGLGIGVGFCYPIGGCRVINDVCTSDASCCSGKCGPPDALGLRRCLSAGNCLADGEVCGGQGASQNCCNGGKANCVKTANGVSRCNPTNGGMCYASGHSCSFGGECCSGICTPDPNSPTGFSCDAMCIQIGAGTCTTDSDCCNGGLCQGGTCVASGQSCAAIGAACVQSADCCLGQCVNGFCSYFGG